MQTVVTLTSGHVPAVDETVVQQLASVVEAVPDVTKHHTEGLSHWDGVPEVSIVLALALLCQQVAVMCLLAVHLFCQCLHTHTTTLSSYKLCHIKERKKSSCHQAS